MNTLSIINKWVRLTDTAIVEEIGHILKEVRLKKNYTQSQLAEISGLSRATISQLENGRAATLLTFVQVLRALDKFDILESLVQEPEISPIQYAKLKGKARKRASGKGLSNNQSSASEW